MPPTANIISAAIATASLGLAIVNTVCATLNATKTLTRVTGLHLISQAVLVIWAACSVAVAYTHNYDQPIAIFCCRIFWMIYTLIYLTIAKTRLYTINAESEFTNPTNIIAGAGGLLLLWTIATCFLLFLSFELDIQKVGKGSSVYETGWSGWTMIFAQSRCEIGLQISSSLLGTVDVDLFVGIIQTLWNIVFFALDYWAQYMILHLLVKSHEKVTRNLKSDLTSAGRALSGNMGSQFLGSQRFPTLNLESVRQTSGQETSFRENDLLSPATRHSFTHNRTSPLPLLSPVFTEIIRVSKTDSSLSPSSQQSLSQVPLSPTVEIQPPSMHTLGRPLSMPPNMDPASLSPQSLTPTQSTQLRVQTSTSQPPTRPTSLPPTTDLSFLNNPPILIQTVPSDSTSNTQRVSTSSKFSALKIVTTALTTRPEALLTGTSLNSSGPSATSRNGMLSSAWQIGTSNSLTPSTKARLSRHQEIRKQLTLTVTFFAIFVSAMMIIDIGVLFILPDCNAWEKAVGGNDDGVLVNLLFIVHWGTCLVPPLHVFFSQGHLKRLKKLISEDNEQ